MCLRDTSFMVKKVQIFFILKVPKKWRHTSFEKDQNKRQKKMKFLYLLVKALHCSKCKTLKEDPKGLCVEEEL